MSLEQGIDLSTAIRVGRLWRLRITGVYPGRIPAGSPDRSLARVVAGAEDGSLYVIERLAQSVAARKMEIASQLEALHGVGLEGVNPYLQTGSGHHVVPLGADYWQISPYLEGALLPRPDWVWEGWRGEALAAWLCELRAAAARVRIMAHPPYSLAGFVEDLDGRLGSHRPDLAESLEPVVGPLLSEWLPSEDALVQGFCHGDPHPLNVIWEPAGHAIRAVIDWEFCGLKPAAYDVALIIGCAGIEDPEALTGPFVQALLAGLRAGGHPSGVETALAALVLAVRFAWLSDWLRRGDEEMVLQEADYIRLLAAHREELGAAWAEA